MKMLARFLETERLGFLFPDSSSEPDALSFFTSGALSVLFFGVSSVLAATGAAAGLPKFNCQLHYDQHLLKKV
jgi:hypothetical protein